MTSSNAEIIAQRREIIDLLKRDQIQRLNLPYRPEDLHDDVSLLGAGLGLDSLVALEIVLLVESAFKVRIPDNDISVLRSINTIVDFILKKRAEGVS